ncbi:uncharacterized protein BDZ99DRAFT_237030 [Mytilinidion resinicola]|uniref:Leucine-rich repeat domain-containing protein n=1 Tax=Mytilinidion resinicola TaxID=574789 RepID=A0A6A6Z294_9PEZI|nr:uncharacterized protein BDZ99DRAFT_237030 [Mytilinidion resinicola]KAF2814414.1 hypothetical protein BDZ99DRAFT_237030 [Mytilinidion resinicola]
MVVRRTRSSITSLWKFFRTIMGRENITKKVRTLHIRNWTFGLVHGRSRFVFPEDGWEVELVRDAIRMAGIEHLERDVMEALRKSDPRPLMALMLTRLAELTTLYVHLPETEIFLAAVLKKTLEGQQDESHNGHLPLQRLEEVHLTSAWNYRKDWRARDNYELRLDHLWPVLQLPSLRKVSLFDFEPLGASARFGNSTRTSGIKDLTIVHHNDSQLTAADALALLAFPKALTRLSIYLNDCNVPQEKPRQLSNADLWTNLRPHRNSLERLDFYRDCTACSPPLHSPANSYFESLRAFTRLKSLCVQAEALLGGYCEDDLAPFRLKDTLPPNLESLTIYGDEGLSTNKTLGEQLQEVVRSADFPRLNRVVLETTSDGIDCYTYPAAPPHEEVERVCRERGVQFKTMKTSSLTRGGIGLRYYRYVKKKTRREMISQTAK